MSNIRVTMVEDEDDFREPVRRYLGKRGMVVRGLRSVEDLEDHLEREEPDIILLDVGLPGEDGLSAVRRLRHKTKAGLIMLTARCDVDSRVQGRTDGADSYLSKPVDFRELEAVIRALKRRLDGVDEAAEAVEDAWTVDLAAWRLINPSGEEVPLSAAQWLVVDLLTQKPGTPVGREALLKAIGLKPRLVEDRRLDVLMSRLRQKLAATMAQDKAPIHTVRNVGYAFTAPVRRRAPPQKTDASATTPLQ
jgi:DNA-binding response OmpR family regulator